MLEFPVLVLYTIVQILPNRFQAWEKILCTSFISSFGASIQPQAGKHALAALHQGNEQRGQNGERPRSDKDVASMGRERKQGLDLAWNFS